MRQAFAGMLWSKQLYYYDVARWLDGDPDPAGPARVAPPRPQLTLAELRRLRHHVDARQVGVPLVRGVGPRVPLRRPRPRRPRLRQVPAASCSAASGSSTPTAPCPRTSGTSATSTRRCRRGRRSRCSPSTAAATSTSSARSSTSCCVNFTWWVNLRGRRRLQPVRGRVPRARQHRPDRPLAPASPVRCSSSPTRPAGWRSTRWRWGRSPPILRRTGQRPADRPGAQVPRALRGHPRRDRAQGVWDDDRRPVLRPPRHAGRHGGAGQGALDGRASSRCSPRSSSTSKCSTAPRRSARSSPDFLDRQGLARPRGAGRARPAARRARGAGSCCSASSAIERLRAALREAVRRARSSSRRTGCARCRPTTASTPTSSRSRGPARDDRLRAGRVDDGDVRRQLQLARPGVVPAQLPRRQRARALRPLLRRRLHRRVPDRSPARR